MRDKIKHIKYLVFLGSIPLFIFGSIFAVNYLVDPLWYFRGNLLTGQNYMWNERFSKANLLLRYPKKYNCVIVGSSRSIVLDATHIDSYRCFNFSFGLGTAREYEEIVRYFQRFNGPPELVIVGIDNTSFQERDSRTREVARIRVGKKLGVDVALPEFVRRHIKPPSALSTYLSYQALRFSLETLMGRSPNRIYYRHDFTGDILPGSGPFHPQQLLNPHFKNGNFPFNGFTTEIVTHLERMRAELPTGTRFVGYAPPVTAHYLARLALDGTLDQFLEISYLTLQIFDEFYDFSAPSAWTRNADLTYDGAHYYRHVNDKIAAVLNGAPVEAALAVHEMSERQYKDRFRSLVQEFIREKSIRLSHSRSSAATATGPRPSGSAPSTGRP